MLPEINGLWSGETEFTMGSSAGMTLPPPLRKVRRG